MKCPDQLLFDRNFGDCNYAQRVICEPKNTICEQFRFLDWLGAIIIGNPLDCSRLSIFAYHKLYDRLTSNLFSFYYCNSGRAIESICPSGLFFNPYTAVCEVMGTKNFCQVRSALFERVVFVNNLNQSLGSRSNHYNPTTSNHY